MTVGTAAQCSLLDDFGSLYPSEIISCEGDFSVGDVVRIFGTSGNEIGRGVINYDVSELSRILVGGVSEIEADRDLSGIEVIHKDDLVLL